MKSTRPGARVLGRPALAYVMTLVIGLSLMLPGAAMAQGGGQPMYGPQMYDQPVQRRAIQVDDPYLYHDGQYYTVRIGDTLSSIARRFDTTTEALMRANGIKNPNRIYVGQVLTVPSSGSGGGTGGVCQREHVVRRGETLSGIAERYRVDPYDLMRSNGISNPNRIYAGQVLCIPTGHGPYPGDPMPPVKPVQPIQPIQPMPPAKPVQPIQPMPPAKPVQPIQPVQPMPPAKPVQPVQPTQPCMPSQPAQPCVPVEPPRPVQPIQPVDPCRPSQPDHPDCRPSHDKEMDFWKGSYFKDKYFSEFVEERKDAEVRFNWYKDAPFEGMPKDRFSVRWERAVYFDGGDYRFYATADDGVRVRVGDTLVIDGWKIQPATEYTGDVSLPRGTQWVVVEYFEEAEDALVSVHWEQRRRHH